MSKAERSPDELALSPRALADAQNAAAAEIVGRAFERGLSEEDVALALREREAAQAAAAGTAGTAAAAASDPGAAAVGAARARSSEGASAEDAAELTRDTIPQRGPLALPRVVAATKPRMQGVALPAPEHDPSLAAERDAADDAPAAAPGKSRAWPLAVALLLGAGALALWWWSKGTEPPQQPSQATSGVPAASAGVEPPVLASAPATASAAATAATTATAATAPRMTASASATVPSAKASAKPSASARPSAAPQPSATAVPSARPPATTSTSSSGGIYILEGDP